VLLVKRPKEDKNLPNVRKIQFYSTFIHLIQIWGLPANYVGEGESPEKAVETCGRVKLGVGLKAVGKIKEGRLERDEYVLRMILMKAKVIEGVPKVPQPFPNVTQYVEVAWREKEIVSTILKPSADKGSLCSQLFLSSDL